MAQSLLHLSKWMIPGSIPVLTEQYMCIYASSMIEYKKKQSDHASTDSNQAMVNRVGLFHKVNK